MKLRIKIVLALIILYAGYFSIRYLPLMLRLHYRPESAFTYAENSGYICWAWTPDGRVIYIKDLDVIKFVKGLGSYGSETGGTVRQIKICNIDGSNDKVIKEIYFRTNAEKHLWRYDELKKISKPGYDFYSQANKESESGYLDIIHPDPPLSKICWLDWNAKNNKLVFIADDGKGKMGIAICNPDFTEINWIYYMKGWRWRNARPQWSPNGRYIALVDSDIIVINIKGYEVGRIKDKTYVDFSWHPNSKLLAVSVGPHECGIFDLKGNYVVQWDKMMSMLGLVISPDGNWIIYVKGIMNLKTCESRRFTHQIWFPKWSPNGKHIIEGWEGGVNILDFKNDKVITLRKVTQEQTLDENVVANFAKGQ